MGKSDSGATQQEIFNKNITKQAMVNYTNPASSGKIQDTLRQRRDPKIHS